MVEAIVGVALRAILASVIFGGVLAALVLIATRALALTAATRHALWTMALIAIAVMPLAGVGTSIWKATAAMPGAGNTAGTRIATNAGNAAGTGSAIGAGNVTETGIATGIPAHRSTSTQRSATQQSGANAVRDAVTPAREGVYESPSAAPWASLADRVAFARWTPRMSRNLALGVLGIWLLGALIGLIGLGASIVRVRGLKRRSSPLDGALADELPWLTEVGPGREIYLRLSYETETPVAIGFRRPVILIPTELATADGLGAIEQLILHEHAHLRRHDDWTNLVQRAIERVFWFNPVVWLVGRRIALEREIASDDAVVEKTGEAHAYATSLWKLAREMRMPEHAVVAPGALLTRKQIAVRIEQLLDKKRARLHRSPAAALGVVLASALAVLVVATSAPAVELPAAPQAPLAAATTAPAAHEASSVHAAPVSHTASTWHAAPAAKQATAPTRTAKVEHTSVAMSEHVRERIVTVYVHATPAPAAVHEDAAPNPPGATSFSVTVPSVPAAPPAKPASSRRAAAERETRSSSSEMRDVANIGPEVARAVSAAVASIPKQIALEANESTRRNHLDGVKISRELIASCVGCSFRGADVRGVDLHGLNINANDFSGADMRGANLSGANLVGVSLRGANLANADLRKAKLAGVELTGANFDGALLDGIKLTGVSLRRVSLRGAGLRSVIGDCTGCDFSHMDLHGQDLHGITLTGADLSHADLHDANLSGVRFAGVNFASANLNGADLTNAHLTGCDLSSVDLRGARTAGMTMTGGGLDG